MGLRSINNARRRESNVLVPSRGVSWLGTEEFGWLAIIAGVGSVCALLDAPAILRIAFGLPLLLFIPGYAFISALFPSDEGLDGLERVGLGFVLSMALIPAVALAIHYSPWSLSLGPMLAGTLVTSAAGSLIALWRRRRLPVHARYRVEINVPRITPPRHWNIPTRLSVGLIALAVALFTVAGGALIIARVQGNPTTEFAVYNAEGDPAFYPRRVAIGQTEPVILEISNLEEETVRYDARVLIDGSEVQRFEQIVVEDDARWRKQVKLRVHEVGENIPVAFELYRGDQSSEDMPYRQLRLTIKGVEP